MTDLLDDLAASQARVVTSADLEAAGVDHNAIVRMRRDGRLIRLFHRTYAVPPITEPGWSLACRGAVAYTGEGAALVGETALAFGTAYPAPADVEVGVPQRRHVRSSPGITVRRLADGWFAGSMNRLGLTVQEPGAAVVWACGRLARTADRRAVVCAAVTAGVTTSQAIRRAVASRPRVRRRGELAATCDHVDAGCESPAEIAYLLDVERRFALPTGVRQAVIEVPGQRIRRIDVRYGRVVVEIDGAHHAREDTRRDDGVRDVVLAALGLHVVRVEAGEIHRAPGLVAATVARALAKHA